MAFHHHEARGRMPGSDGFKKYNLHLADLLHWLRSLSRGDLSSVRRQTRTNIAKVGGGMDSVNGRCEKNKIIFCDSAH
jgi:hypothetical protein